MLLDTALPLGQPYFSNEEVRAAMVEIAQHKIDGREAAVHWFDHLRFLASTLR